MSGHRTGILAGGNFIVDQVKIIDHYPPQEMLASILSESQSNGGGPYNVLKDLAAMRVDFPLAAAGLVGIDDDGSWILKDCHALGIGTRHLKRTSNAPTSHTYAMIVKASGRRTFFHRHGANALLDVDDFDFTGSSERIFHLGYLLLLERLDSFDKERTRASQLLERAQIAGLETSVDTVSIDNPRFQQIARSALPYTDHLIINEVEAGKIVGRRLSQDDIDGICGAVLELLALGVTRSVVVHFEKGTVAAENSGSVHVQGSLDLPEGFSKGATGAGDAFAAGYLYGVHEHWPMRQRIDLALCAAAACLTHPTPSAGLRSVENCLALGQSFPRRLLR